MRAAAAHVPARLALVRAAARDVAHGPRGINGWHHDQDTAAPAPVPAHRRAEAIRGVNLKAAPPDLGRKLVAATSAGARTDAGARPDVSPRRLGPRTEPARPCSGLQMRPMRHTPLVRAVAAAGAASEAAAAAAEAAAAATQKAVHRAAHAEARKGRDGQTGTCPGIMIHGVGIHVLRGGE